MILKPKPCSFPLQRYGCCKNHFRIHANGDVNFDKLVHENMFVALMLVFANPVTCCNSCKINDHAGYSMSAEKVIHKINLQLKV